MEAIYGEDSRELSNWLKLSDRTIKVNYTLKDLALSYEPSNQIWYWLHGTTDCEANGSINGSSIGNLYHDKVRAYFSQIDNSLKIKEFNRQILADISNDFFEFYIPSLIELTRANQAKLPNSVRAICISLVFIFVVGVFFPLFIQCLDLQDKWNINLTLVSVGLIIILFADFLFNFYKIMNEEIQMA